MRVWVEAARPRTLVAGIVPVLVGTAASGAFIPWRFGAALLVALAIQVGTNYANDYFDWRHGVDTPARAGPRRATASGLVTPRQMKVAIGAAMSISVVFGTALALAAGKWLVVIGALSIAAALAYSGGPRPYGGAGLGELAVFLFFGVVATAGAAYIQAETFTATAFAASVPVGLVAAAILVANNVRDIDTDRLAGKMTFAVRLGRARTRAFFTALVAGAFAFLPVVALAAGSPWPLVGLVAAPAAAAPVRLVGSREDAPGLVAALRATTRLHLLLGVALAVGLWMS